MGGIDVDLLVVPACAHQVAAEDLLRAALVDVGLPADFQVVTIGRAKAGFLTPDLPPMVPTCSRHSVIRPG
jgi:hypothetical protein